MDSSSHAKSNDIPLSLISRLCDSRLKELSNISYPGVFSDNSNVSQQYPGTSSLYSEVLRDSLQASTTKHFSTLEDFSNPENQQLRIHRKVALSRHIKPVSLASYLPGVNEVSSDSDECYLVDSSDNDDDAERKSKCSKQSHLKERLESYLPILTQRIKDGKWKDLRLVQSLQTVVTLPCSANVKELPQNVDAGHRNPNNWDREQGFVLSSTMELKAYFGVVDKPNSISSQRLAKLLEQVGVASLPLQSMMNRSNALHLQDDTARIRLNDLCGKLKYTEVVPGIAVAIIGRISGACLHAEDVVFPTPCNPEWPLPRDNNIEMVFISGLYMGSDEGSSISLDLLQDYLLGLAGSAYEQSNLLASRLRVFVLGNLISNKVATGKSSNETNHVAAVCTKNMELLDSFLEPLARVMEVFLVPGESDLTLSSTLPQPPLHPRLFPEAGRFPSTKFLTNPAVIQTSVSQSVESSSRQQSEVHKADSECSLMMSSVAEFLKDDVDFLDLVLQSGQNVRHTMDYCDISCPIEMGKQLLKWGHLNPVSSENSTLARDTFSIKGSLPHVMVVGNLSDFKSVTWNETKIIGVPSFRKTSTAVVLTKEFDVIPVSFKLL